jgi:Copper binding periplasmic protein CusF
MKISKRVFTAMLAIGLGSSCAYAQTTTATIGAIGATATFTAVVANVDRAAGTISLTQTLSLKPAALGDSPTMTADYQASSVLLNKATVGATVQVTVGLINGFPAITALQAPSVAPVATTSSTLTPVGVR